MKTVQYIPAHWRELTEWNPSLVCHPREVEVLEFADGKTATYCEAELARIETLLWEILK